MTGGALTWVNQTWPGASFSGQVKYVSVAGRAVRGDRDADRHTLRCARSKGGRARHARA